MPCVLLRFLRCCLPLLSSQKTYTLQFELLLVLLGLLTGKVSLGGGGGGLRKFKQVVGCGDDLLKDIFRPIVGVSVKFSKNRLSS